MTPERQRLFEAWEKAHALYKGLHDALFEALQDGEAVEDLATQVDKAHMAEMAALRAFEAASEPPKTGPIEPRFSDCKECGRTDRRAGVTWGCRECQRSQGIVPLLGRS